MNIPEELKAMTLKEKSDHCNIPRDDIIYFFGERTSRMGYGYSDCNDFISNLKKSVNTRGTGQYKYKTRAINLAIKRLLKVIGDIIENDVSPILVPVPPSKSKQHPEYDPRLIDICNGVAQQSSIVCRELIIQNSNMMAAHESEDRLTIDELVAEYHFNAGQLRESPDHIYIFDDVLTAGNHYAAVKTVLRKNLGTQVKISGIFLAKTVRPSPFEVISDII